MSASRSRPSIGYALSSEEHAPLDLVTNAVAAEAAGFDFAMISDHFHPWVDQQGNSPFVWSVLGAIAGATSTLRLGTGVTCPTMRIHPAIIAQAAATTAAMMPGRFFFGVGTGENLNEHILGQRWPAWDVRAEMLEEAIDVIRRLWTGEQVSHRGRTTRSRTLACTPCPRTPRRSWSRPAVSGWPRSPAASATGSSAPRRTEPWSRRSDPGIIAVRATGRSRCAGPSASRTPAPRPCAGGRRRRSTAKRPRSCRTRPISSSSPRASPRTTIAKVIPCGPNVDPILEQIQAYIDADYDHVYLHQVGPDQEGFIDFAKRRLLPALA